MVGSSLAEAGAKFERDVAHAGRSLGEAGAELGSTLADAGSRLGREIEVGGENFERLSHDLNRSLDAGEAAAEEAAAAAAGLQASGTCDQMAVVAAGVPGP